MTQPTIQIGNEQREMTEAEFAQWQADVDAHKQHAAELVAKSKARESALAKLAALGLTEAEIAALVA
jgi:hypothetical protein